MPPSQRSQSSSPTNISLLDTDPSSSSASNRRSYASILRGAEDWTVEDVDPNDNLNDLNPFRPDTGLPLSNPGPSSRTTSGASLHVSPRDIALDTLPWRRHSATAPAEGRHRLISTVDTHASDANDPASSRLAPRLSLDDLLGSVPIATSSAAATSSRAPSNLSRSRPVDLHIMDISAASLNGWMPQDSVDFHFNRDGTWMGGVSAARPQGYRDGTAMNRFNPPGDLPPSVRSRNRRFRQSAFQITQDPDEVLTWDEELDISSGSEQDEQPRRSGNRVYFTENRTTDDLQVLGGSGGAISLNRGANNRRRRSLRERLASQIQSEAAALGSLSRESSIDQGSSRSGMTPTNESEASRHTPLVVRSSGIRKERESLSPKSPSPKKKRRKMEPTPPLERPSRPTYLQYSTLSHKELLPTDFLPPARDSHVSLGVHKDKLGSRPMIYFSYVPRPREFDADHIAAALRTATPIPVACGIHYYEALVVDAGEEGHMSVGWIKSGVNLGRLVGWETGSWGWHGDDGKTFEGRGTGDHFGEKWGAGDIVGCGVDFTLGRAFFTKNGKLVGYRFKNLGAGLFPAVGLRTPREALAVNFTGPFAYDIDNHVREVRDRVWKSALRSEHAYQPTKVPRLVDQLPTQAADIQATSPPNDVGSSGTKIPNLDASSKTSLAFVLDYLSHQGFISTLSSAQQEMARRKLITNADVQRPTTTPSFDSQDARLASFDSASSAFSWLHDRIMATHLYPVPWPLIKDLIPLSYISPGIVRLLSIQDLVYLSHDASLKHISDEMTIEEERVLEKGQELMSRCRTEKWTKDEERGLQEAFGLMSLPVEEWSAEVASENSRETLADRLLAVIKAHRGVKPRSHLEQALLQTMLVSKRLASIDAEAAFVDVKRILEQTAKPKDEVKTEPEEH